MPLNEHQKRSLEIGMRQLERGLRDGRKLLFSPERGILTCYQPVPEDARRHLAQLVQEMLAEIATVAAEFQLPSETLDPRRVFVGLMVVESANLYDLESAKLVGYGSVDPALTRTLDPHLRRLLDLAKRMTRVAHSR